MIGRIAPASRYPWLARVPSWYTKRTTGKVPDPLRLLEDFPADANLELQHTNGLETMNGLEWLVGYAGHEAFHHRQIGPVIAQSFAANWPCPGRKPCPSNI